MNHFNLSCELVSHQYLWRENAGKLGEGGEGREEGEGMSDATSPPQFLMEMVLPLHQLMTNPNLIEWSEVANTKCMCFVFTSESNMATSHRLK